MKRPELKQSSNPVLSTIIYIVIIAGFGWFLFQLDLTALIFGKVKTTPNIQTMTKEQYQEITDLFNKQQMANQNLEERNLESADNLQPDNTKEVKPYPVGTIFKYIDRSGAIAMVDDIEKVPSQYRKSMKVSAVGAGQQITPIEVLNNKVYTPVTISYQGRTVVARLLLDTGATGISITPALANRLGVRPTSRGTATFADGSQKKIDYFTCDNVSVGSKSKSMIRVGIIPSESSDEAGLLGMSFLADYPHTVDLKAKVIRWF